MSFLDDAISNIGRGLAQSAVQAASDATGMDVGGTLNFLFNGQTTGGEQLATLQSSLQSDWSGTPEQLTALQNGLAQQSQTLSDIGTQLTSVAASVGAISVQIHQISTLLTQINQQQLFQSWQTVDVAMSGYLAAISTSYATYGKYVLAASETDGTLVQDLVVTILDPNVGPAVGITAIHNLIMGNGQAQSVLQLWSAMVAPLVSGGLMDYREAVQQYEAYYKQLAYAQLCGTNLLMEAYNYDAESSSTLAAGAYTDYKAALLAQEDMFIRWMVPLVAAGVVGGVTTNGIPFSSADAAVQLNPGVQTLPGAADPGASFYAASPVFRGAESLLASLSVTDPADRRVVVHMAYLAGTNGSSLGSLHLTMTSLDGESQVSPVTSTRLGGPYFIPLAPGGGFRDRGLPDMNFATVTSPQNGFYVKRFVFSDDVSHGGLADTQYSLDNLNGINGLVALQTYLSGTGDVPFMNDNIPQNVLQVNAAQPFDFMNFLAYCEPVDAIGYPW